MRMLIGIVIYFIFHVLNVGSISHKDDLAVGVACIDTNGRVGVDLEHVYNKAATSLWRRVLTDDEKGRLGNQEIHFAISSNFYILSHHSYLNLI